MVGLLAIGSSVHRVTPPHRTQHRRALGTPVTGSSECQTQISCLIMAPDSKEFIEQLVESK